MKHLLYCVSRRPSDDMGKVPLGIDGRPVYLIEKNHICAVVSALEESPASEDVASAIAYHRVIESFNGLSTVIPLRFGTYLDKEIEIARLLERQGQRYERLLTELFGCVEMGLRIVVRDISRSDLAAFNSCHGSCSESNQSGQEYLKRRKAHYDLESIKAEELRSLEIICRTAFDGLYTKFKHEAAPIEGEVKTTSNLVSFYFLAPRKSLEDFRKAFAGLKARLDAKSMLSGPWPPVNFVLPTDFTECDVRTRRV